MTKTRLEPIAPGLWGAEHDLFMNGFIHFRGRMTVVALDGGGVLLHSAIPIDDALAAELSAIGPVKHIVAPNRLHHVHLPDVMPRYPDATVWAAPGLDKKRKDIAFDAELGSHTPAWSSELDSLFIAGVPWADETVFLHRASRTLVVTDLVFNIQSVQGWLSKWVLKMAGAYGRLAQSKMLRFATRDRAAVGRSVQQLLDWDFDRLVMAHGDIIESGAKDRLREALWWMRGDKALATSSAA